MLENVKAGGRFGTPFSSTGETVLPAVFGRRNRPLLNTLPFGDLDGTVVSLITRGVVILSAEESLIALVASNRRVLKSDLLMCLVFSQILSFEKYNTLKR